MTAISQDQETEIIRAFFASFEGVLEHFAFFAWLEPNQMRRWEAKPIPETNQKRSRGQFCLWCWGRGNYPALVLDIYTRKVSILNYQPEFVPLEKR